MNHLSVIDQTTQEYQEMFKEAGLDPGDLVTYHSLSDRTYGRGAGGEDAGFLSGHLAIERGADHVRSVPAGAPVAASPSPDGASIT